MNSLDSGSFKPFDNCKSEVYLYGAHEASVSGDWSCRRHLHHMMLELNLVLEGAQIAEISGNTIRQGADELILVPPMRLHSFQADGSLRYFVFHLQIDDPTFFQRLGQSELIQISRSHPLNSRLLPKIRNLRELIEGKAGKMRLFHAVYDILDTLDTYMHEHREAFASKPADPLPVLIAKEIETLVTETSHTESTLPSNWMEVIANRLGYSRRHCFRAFRDTFRMAPRDYMFVLRQQEAMQLLANGEDTLERIAYRIGYDNVQSFIRQFSKWTNMTPGAFRKQSRGDIVYLTPLELE